MEINREMLAQLRALDDKTLYEKIMKLMLLTGKTPAESGISEKDMSKVKAMLGYVRGEDVKRLLGDADEGDIERILKENI